MDMENEAALDAVRHGFERLAELEAGVEAHRTVLESVIAEARNAGLTFDDMARVTGLSPAALRWYTVRSDPEYRATRAKSKEAELARNREATALGKPGVGPVELGKLVGLSRATVYNRIREARDAGELDTLVIEGWQYTESAGGKARFIQKYS